MTLEITWLVPVFLSIVASLLVAGVVGVWAMKTELTALSTKMDALLSAAADHETRLRLLERAAASAIAT